MSNKKPEEAFLQDEFPEDPITGLDSIDAYTEDYLLDLSPIEIEPEILQKMTEEVREHAIGLFETYDVAMRNEIISYHEDEDDWEDISVD